MKLPRNCSAQDLIKASKILGYEATRQTDSHIRISTIINGQHHLIIPNHSPIKIGTLSAILSDMALHHKLSKEALVDLIF